MCLYDFGDDAGLFLGEGTHTARKEHRCGECGRVIDPGETYRWWKGVSDGFVYSKMCAHCWATIELGCALTGCPQFWYWGSVHDLSEDEGFVGNILYDEGHDLTPAQRLAMLRTVAGRRRRWRWADGTLMAVPA